MPQLDSLQIMKGNTFSNKIRNSVKKEQVITSENFFKKNFKAQKHENVLVRRIRNWQMLEK